MYPGSLTKQFDSSRPIDSHNYLTPYILNDDIEIPFYNLLQTVYAAIRVDMGNPSMNNFILNPSALNLTIYEKFPATANQDETTSTFYDQSSGNNPKSDLHLPINVPGPAQIQVVYTCRTQQRKSLGSLITSVLVATLSMFSIAWAAFISAATAFVKRTDPAGIFSFPPRSVFLLAYLEFSQSM